MNTLRKSPVAGRWAGLLGLLLFCATVPNAQAAVEVNFWHSYTHQPSGVIHFAFHIASYKRGIFFGSCGPSTKSLQWEYEVDLAGKGPVYEANQITITNEGKKVPVSSGTIVISAQEKTAKIDLQVESGGTAGGFAGNGSWRIRHIK
jgi:hypothetical protein